MKKTKKQTYNLALASGQTGGTEQTFRFQTDASYYEVIGYTVWENSSPGVEYQLGLKDDNETYHALTNSRDFLATTAVGKKDRYEERLIRAEGNFLTLSFKPLANTTAALNIDLVLILRGRKGSDCDPNKAEEKKTAEEKK